MIIDGDTREAGARGLQRQIGAVFRNVAVRVAETGDQPLTIGAAEVAAGGVREKVIAAARAGIDTVLIQARNHRDDDDIPPSARERLRFVWLDTVDDAVAETLGSPASADTFRRAS